MHPTSLLLLLFTLLAFSSSLQPTASAGDSKSSDVEEACAVTEYKGVCVRSLSSFSGGVGKSPTRWARAGVSVTIGEVKRLVRFVRYVEKVEKKGKSRRVRSRESDALSTCVEVVQDALDNLHQSLYVLRKLERGAFKIQMGNVLTWLSAALTDHETCTDSFEDVDEGRAIAMIKRKVKHASYLTSNALALVDKLSTTGLQDREKD